MEKSRFWRESLCVVLSFTIFIAGCGGHSANPVDRYMMGDEKKSCNALYAEVSQLDEELALKKKEKDNRDTWNIILFVGGLFVIVPFFFMDVKNSQEVEIDALQARKKALMNIFHDKNCTAPIGAVGQYMSESSDPNAPDRKVIGYRTIRGKTDARGNPVLEPVYEDDEQK